MDYLREDRVVACQRCRGAGYLDGQVCACLLLTRVYLWLSAGGFSETVLNYVTDEVYEPPELESGEGFFRYYSANPQDILDNGLSLYIFSREAGRGKTTLAYYLMVQLARYFMRTENYRPGLTFAFENVNDLMQREQSFKEEGIWNATFYVLDDLGNEDRSTKMKREMVTPLLQRVLHYRQDNSLPTIVTANYMPDDLGGLYANRLDSLLEINVDGTIGGNLFRQIEVGGGEDLRTLDNRSNWPEDL